ncbi:CHAT domain-containing protein [Micromonospora cremea]|uniref:TIR domain-containing protein n=1 Tax=Micromonospora cremea TaxID=709881 RepID=A0A1N5V2D0_9ACTN|nr:CHAT domain-containing protein [Micromonospora cremea]SIM67100.1 TIR domain-containing protein [Micromonospora cremea]
MVSFFLSYRLDDESVAARLIDDALSARFGSDNVFRDTRSLPAGADLAAELSRRLADSTALIVVIGRRWRGDAVCGLGNPPHHIQREIEFAFDLNIPVIPVLVGGAEPPRETDLPAALRPLARRQFWQIHQRTADADIRDLIDDLATRFGADVGAGPVVPLILSEKPVPRLTSPFAHRAAVAVVYSSHEGDLEVADPRRPMRWTELLIRSHQTRYEVDISDHHLVLDVTLPAKDDLHHFTATLAVDFRVTDPAEVVRLAITNAVTPVRDFLVHTLRPISREFTVDEAVQAEMAIERRLGSDNLVPGGITLRSVRTRLGVDDQASRYLREGEQARGRLLDLAAEHRLQLRELLEADDWRGVEPGPLARSTPGTGWHPKPLPLPVAAGQPERLLVARAPTQVPAGQDLSVDVRIVTEGRPFHPDAVTSPLANLLVADDGTPVTVTVHAPAGLHNEGPLQQTVLVTPTGDPPPIRFGFGARTAGLYRIDVTAWAGGTFLTEVSVEVSVAAGGPFRDGQPKTAPLGAPQARPGEVTMEVRFDGSRYTFQLRSDAGELFAPVVESVTNTPNAAVENAIRELQQLAGGGSRYSARMTREVIRSAGIQLWSEMVPADVQDQFWQVGSGMSALTIATDYDVVPWELLYPLSARQDSGFLVEQVPVVRRTYGQQLTRKVGLRDPRFVVPRQAPSGAHEEIAAIRAILGAADGEPISRADDLLALINSGRLGATHFACHNTFSADGSFIDMDGGRFKPALLAEASIRRLLKETGPLVFINACRSAGAAPTYTKMLGWAQQFMSSGAGAFVGTLWAVRSESSARFATAFYRSFAEGATLGAAALAARREQQDDPLDPTWLAYTVYGDPYATAA